MSKDFFEEIGGVSHGIIYGEKAGREEAAKAKGRGHFTGLRNSKETRIVGGGEHRGGQQDVRCKGRRGHVAGWREGVLQVE